MLLLDTDVTANWMTSNQNLHHHAKAKKTKALREQAKTQALTHHIPTPTALVCTIQTPTRRRLDPPNTWPVFKALIDGLVDAGVLPDDSHKEVPQTIFQRNPQPTKNKTYRATIEAAPITNPNTP